MNRLGGGRPRTRPQRVRADKAYSSRAIRGELRRRGITAVIPQPSDQIAHRTRRCSRGGRPPAFAAADYKSRNVIERGFNVVKQWPVLALVTTNSPSSTAPRGDYGLRPTAGRPASTGATPAPGCAHPSPTRHAESPWKQATASTFSGEPQIYHRTCESIEIHLSVVFAAIAA